MKNAIVCLTRGYETIHGYNKIIQRNKAIFKHINSKLAIQYPLVIFHQGNINFSDQNHITKQSNDQLVVFVNVSDVWIPDPKFSYEMMCRFMSYHLWNFCKEYDNVMRIDEDCILTKCDHDPFSLLGDYDYLKSVYWAESHSETNATLPEAIKLMTGADPKEFYNDKFPYTNVSLCKTSLWLNEPMNGLLKALAVSSAQMQNRWGDLPLLGSLLNIYSKGKVGSITGMNYYHESHDSTIVSV